MVYALGLDLGGGPVTAAIKGPESVGLERDVVEAPGSAAQVDRLLERFGDPQVERRGGDVTTVGTRLAALVAACVSTVTATEGTGPDSVVVAHPSSWGAYRVRLLRDALREQGVSAEPLAAAAAVVAHADADGARDRSGVVAVLDVREEHVEVSVVSTGADASPGTLVGVPRTVRDLGSADVDDAVLAHVRAVTAPASASLAAHRGEAADLRAACAAAGARLMSAPAASVTWTVAGERREVRVVAAELDARLRPRAGRAIAAAADAVAAAAGAVDRVVLVGRIAAMPLLTELVAERFEAPVTVLGESSHAVACGAARVAFQSGGTPGAGNGPGDVVGRPVHGRRAHLLQSRRRPAGAAALVGGWVVALAITALAVWGTAVAAPGTPAQGHVPAVSPSPQLVVDGAPARPGGKGVGAPEEGTVLGPSAHLAPRPAALASGVRPDAAALPGPVGPATDDGASAG